jgi:hypothetical protein
MDPSQAGVFSFPVLLDGLDRVPILASLGDAFFDQFVKHGMVLRKVRQRVEVRIPVARFGNVESFLVELAYFASDAIAEYHWHIAPTPQGPVPFEFCVLS